MLCHHPLTMVAIPVLALLALSGCGDRAAHAGRFDSEPPVAGTAPTNSVSTSATPVPIDGVPADAEEVVAHDLHSVMNIDIRFTVGTTIDGVSVDTVLAQNGLDFPKGTDVYTAYVTTPDIGRDLQTDTKPPEVIPKFDNEHVWILREPGYITLGSGGQYVPSASPTPIFYPVHDILIIDSSGDFYGSVVGDGPPSS
jgi:hypothetical protein